MKLDYNALAKDYAEHRHVHPGVLTSLREGGQLHSASHVLEVGCGTGNYILALHEGTGCSAWGIDPSEQMLAGARRRNHEIQFELGKAEKLNFPSAFFDLVFSVDVIHHVPDREAYHHEAYRVLKPGGKFCTVTDSEDIIRKRRPLSNYFPETVEVELKRYPCITDLRAMMIRVGFDRLEERIVELALTITQLESYREKAFSSLHLISPEAFDRGIQRMEADLSSGPITGVSRYLLLWGTK